jgi:pimeloyl-ACP methyl ester carboxylesterase
VILTKICFIRPILLRRYYFGYKRREMLISEQKKYKLQFIHLFTICALIFGLLQAQPRNVTAHETAPTEAAQLLIAPNKVALHLPTLNHTAAPHACKEGTQSSGAKYRICMPAGAWNKILVMYAHGYVAYNEPIAITSEAEQLGKYLNEQGYAFAATSYSVNGLAIKQGIADEVELAKMFKASNGSPNKTYIVGFSEGGLITTLAVERHPNVFDGGLAMCGPIGDFHTQTSYFGDFRVVFDYFFPGVIAGTAISIPQSEIDTFNSRQNVIATTLLLFLQPVKRQQLLDVTKVPIDSTPSQVLSSTTASIGGLLFYSVFATNDANRKLGGQPYTNAGKQYQGSTNDSDLNAKVARYTADVTATAEIDANYQTTGNLTRPLVVMHTTDDPIVPFVHQTLYQTKVANAGKGNMLSAIPIQRYGHCSFTAEEIAAGLARLAGMTVFLPLTTNQAVTKLLQ